MGNSNRLGELLVREKLISLAQLRHAQDEQQKSGQNLGYTLANNIDLGPALAPVGGNYPGMWAAAGFVPIGPGLKFRTSPGLTVEDVKFTFMSGELFSLPGLNGFYIEVSNCESEGVVRAASRDPRVQPSIDHRYFSNGKDLDRMVGAAKVALEVARVVGDSTKFEVLLPDPESARDEEALRGHFLEFHATDYHPSGTLRMGPEGDEMAVVDERCRLRGIENLYVADASVMPTIPRANINLPTMMIGERVAEFVHADL